MSFDLKRLEELAKENEKGVPNTFNAELRIAFPTIVKRLKAADELAKAVEGLGLHSGERRAFWRSERDAALSAYREAIKE